ncbi:MAG: hypothetical protein J2O47_02935 [Acidimicrobiaceae bacterium]|nr:hypothetical protein [Acidimicrobiaceae bacterium]
MPDLIEVDDLPASVLSRVDESQLDLWLAGVNATARRVAPCLRDDADPPATEDQLAETRLILLGAVTRWVDTGPGAFQQQTAGPFSVTTDTRQRTGFKLWPTEITALQDVCRGEDEGKAFHIDTAPRGGDIHALVCSLRFGGASCSCGADLAGYPLWGRD